ncbi:MAG TPA: hypothetical protein VFS22_03030 [Flavisolibacter sp.]|nr:hypothetical protein [Flavisolibacter sp.]
MKEQLILAAPIAVLLYVTLAFQKPDLQDTDHFAGTWEIKKGTEEQVLLFIDGYFTNTVYDKKNRRFFQTSGGSYSIGNDKLNITYEFDTENKERVGQTVSYSAHIKNKKLMATINGAEEIWNKIDEGNSDLSGLWTITARKQEGRLVSIHQTDTRKTVKILSGTRFQWAAIDPGTKQFMGTGGGTFTFVNGTYTENIAFFSRDSSRVGSTLTFDGKLENGDWHHSGLSSKGDPIYEIWSRKN